MTYSPGRRPSGDGNPLTGNRRFTFTAARPFSSLRTRQRSVNIPNARPASPANPSAARQPAQVVFQSPTRNCERNGPRGSSTMPVSPTFVNGLWRQGRVRSEPHRSPDGLPSHPAARFLADPNPRGLPPALEVSPKTRSKSSTNRRPIRDRTRTCVLARLRPDRVLSAGKPVTTGTHPEQSVVKPRVAPRVARRPRGRARRGSTSGNIRPRSNAVHAGCIAARMQRGFCHGPRRKTADLLDGGCLPKLSRSHINPLAVKIQSNLFAARWY